MALQVLNILLITAVLATVMAGMPGGLSEEKPPNDEVQALIDTVRPEVEEKLGHRVSKYTLEGYKTQIVAGVNYFAKVDIGEGSFVHLRVYRSLNQNVSLSALQYPKDPDQPITYF